MQSYTAARESSTLTKKEGHVCGPPEVLLCCVAYYFINITSVAFTTAVT